MSVSKFVLLSFTVLATNAAAQTIDSYADSSKAVSQPVPQEILQTPLGQALPAVDAGKPSAKRGTHLVGVFSKSGGGGQVEFSVDGRSEVYGVGDIMRGGWEIVSISSTTVSLKKCGSAKSSRCATKKYAYQGG